MPKLDGKKMTGDEKLDMMANPKKFTLVTPTTKGSEPSGDSYKGSQGKVRIPITHKGSLGEYKLSEPTTVRRESLSSLDLKPGKIVQKLNALAVFTKNHSPSLHKKIESDIKFIQSKETKK